MTIAIVARFVLPTEEVIVGLEGACEERRRLEATWVWIVGAGAPYPSVERFPIVRTGFRATCEERKRFDVRLFDLRSLRRVVQELPEGNYQVATRLHLTERLE